jgi:Yip1 domain
VAGRAFAAPVSATVEVIVMERENIVARAKRLLVTPNTEWPVIAAEPASVRGLYSGYIVIMAAIPAIAHFIKSSLIGYGGFGVTVRTPFFGGLLGMVVTYLLSLFVLYVVSLIVNALAPTFGATRDPIQALKVTAYAWTASWVASIFVILPWLGWLIALAGAIYSIYLLYLGLPYTMKCPPDKAAGYTALTVVITVVLTWIVAAIIGVAIGTAMFGGASMMGGRHHLSSSASVDSDSTLSRLSAMGQSAGQAGKDAHVEALGADQIKAFLPESLDGLKRESLSAQHNAAIGMQVSEAQADYSDGASRSLHIAIADAGTARGMLAMAAAMAPETDQETDHGYTKTYSKAGQMISERWDSNSHEGEYSVVVGQRFTVKASGHVDNFDQLKAAVGAIDLGKLESLRDSGVTKN